MDTIQLWKSLLFGPGMRLMNRLKYPQKFVLITLLLVAPLALVMYFLISEINARVDFSQKELYGTAYLRPLNSLLRSLGNSHLPARADTAGHSFQLADWVRTQAALTADIERLEATDHRLGSILDTGE